MAPALAQRPLAYKVVAQLGTDDRMNHLYLDVLAATRAGAISKAMARLSKAERRRVVRATIVEEGENELQAETARIAGDYR